MFRVSVSPPFKSSPTQISTKHTCLLTLLVMFALAAASIALASDESPNEEQQLAELFANADILGTFVLFDVSANEFTFHNKTRAEKRFIPASTFKIPNSLIGLSTHTVKSVDEVIPYGGKPQPIKSWEQDMGLRDAIKISNVPVYQELARRIGLQQMRENVTKLNYGNTEIGAAVDLFWLQGPLEISALEQTRFLARLANYELPYSKSVQQQVHEITKLDQGAAWVLHGKTGWAVSSPPHIGWWVGWVVKDEEIFSFALNIDMPNISDAAKRIELGKGALRILGVIGADH